MEEMNLDLSEQESKTKVENVNTNTNKTKRVSVSTSTEEVIPCCLTNKKIIVRYIPRDTGFITNPKHIFYGGMAESAIRTYTTPVLNSGVFVNVLTKNEKAYLEEIMGVEQDALSIYNAVNNYWETFFVRLTKGDNILDLSTPIDYIKYKVLLANKNFVASSLDEVQNYPKATYQFVIISEDDESKRDDLNLSFSMRAYMKLGEVMADADILKLIIETFEGRALSPSVKLNTLKIQANKAVQANPKLFLSIAEDPMLDTKVLIRKGIERGIIVKRGDFLYIKEDNQPLCEYGEDPILINACKYLNAPKHQEVKFMVEAKIKN